METRRKKEVSETQAASGLEVGHLSEGEGNIGGSWAEISLPLNPPEFFYWFFNLIIVFIYSDLCHK